MTQNQATRQLGLQESVQEAGTAAFGGYGMAQATHLFAREVPAPQRAEAIEVAPRTWFLRLGIVNAGLFATDEGLVLVDCGCAGDGPELLRAVRECSDLPLHTVVLTHGHVDHAFGLWSLLEAGERPRVVAHQNITAHYERYAKTHGLNTAINFQVPGENGKAWPQDRGDFLWPDTVFRDTLELVVGDERFVLRHAKGETDDAVWLWAPERGVIAAGDLVTGYLPNCGNPRKVQRFAEEWADAAEEMAARDAEIVLPGHGEVVRGAEAIRDELTTMAAYLRHIVRHAVDGLNAGRLPEEIVSTLRIPDELARHPRLQPLYDRPEFICRNVLRRYGGWWDGRPANLLPAPAPDQAREVARLAGGAAALAARARELVAEDLRLACHLAEWAFLADPQDEAAQETYREVFAARADVEPSLMAKVAFGEPESTVAAVRAAATAEKG
ncbi:alkyl sulfatase dimerization domain-containing protein [Saccharopolyspora sp. 5N102]|uniref:alkyl sulfatase dimerization domain-containing protein n=1 Tax=Saccharopolyspora sp. 5N102 TaxID=3375155 RepID=UPI0037BC73EA